MAKRVHESLPPAAAKKFTRNTTCQFISLITYAHITNFNPEVVNSVINIAVLNSAGSRRMMGLKSPSPYLGYVVSCFWNLDMSWVLRTVAQLHN